jgi:hypothetical protein
MAAMVHRLSLILAAGVFAGCAQRATRPPSGEGRSSFTFVEAPAPGGRRAEVSLATEREPLTVFVEARLLEPVAKPAYPSAARRGSADTALVGVRITIDVDGRVTDVGESLACFSTPGPLAKDFREAVEAAVAQWKFMPAKRRQLEPVRMQDGGFYWRNAGEEKVESALDVASTFGAGGEISSQPARK